MSFSLTNKVLKLALCFGLISLTFFDYDLAYGQRRLDVKQNKLGISVQTMYQSLEVLSNQLAGEKSIRGYLVPGIELFYERIIDDSFSWGGSFNFFIPPTLNIKTKDSEVVQFIPLLTNPRPDERYQISNIQFAFGIFGKAYTSPNRTRGLKPFVQTSFSLLFSILNMKESTKSKTYNPVSLIVMQSFSLGFDYNYRNGFAWQLAARYVSGFSNNELQKEYKYVYVYTNSLMVELGALYSF